MGGRCWGVSGRSRSSLGLRSGLSGRRGAGRWGLLGGRGASRCGYAVRLVGEGKDFAGALPLRWMGRAFWVVRSRMVNGPRDSLAGGRAQYRRYRDAS